MSATLYPDALDRELQDRVKKPELHGSQGLYMIETGLDRF